MSTATGPAADLPENRPFPPLRHWRAELDSDRTVWLGLDQQDSRTNVLSRAVLEEFGIAIDALESMSGAVRGLVIWSAKPGTFIAGADVREFPEIRSTGEAYDLVRSGQRLLDRLERLAIPSVAVMNGFALGGGLELALACRWRLGLKLDEPCIGFPEVQLGVHPGFGGTVRSVRLAGVRKAMDLMLTGRSIRTAEALRIGLIDQLVESENWRSAATALLADGPHHKRLPLVERAMSWPLLRGYVARSLESRARARVNPAHFPAPFALIDLWRKHSSDADGGMEAEAHSFAALVGTATSRNLVRVFFLQERLKRASRDHVPIRRVHVVGAGIMGGDIAAWCALKGMHVTLQDRELKYVEPALTRAEKLFGRRLSGEIDQRAARDRLVADVAGEGVAAADLVIEAIFENRDAKQALYGQLEPRMRADAVLATNTSSIPLQDLSAGLGQPRRFIGLHFFNPVARLPLIEVVQTGDTSADSMETGLAFARQIGKLPVPCKSQPGFLVNRILAPYMAEALELAREGVPLAVIDYAATEFGMPMGPIELADSVGLDIALHVARILAPVTGRTPSPELERLVQAGHLGQKTGRGFYVYQGGKPVRPRGTVTDIPRDAQDRLVLSLLNEAADCLAEGVVADADLVDAGVIFGTGFAPFRGGPLHYAQERGVSAVISDLQQLEKRLGSRFAPSPGWQKLPPAR